MRTCITLLIQEYRLKYNFEIEASKTEIYCTETQLAGKQFKFGHCNTITLQTFP